MNKHLALLLSIGLVIAQEDTYVAVFNLENNGLKDSQVRTIRNRLESELKKTGLKVVEREQINDLFKEQQLQLSGVVEDSLVRKVGAMLGATHVLLGSVGKMDETYYTISAKLVDGGTGELMKTADYDALNGLPDLMKNGTKNIASSLFEIEIEKGSEKPSQYIFTIGNVLIDDRDFSRSGWGNPLNIGIAVWKDGEIIQRINVGKVRGLEGINKKLPIVLNLNSVYKLFIGETDGLLTSNKVYEWNTIWEGVEKAKESDKWFFNKGKLKIGQKSYIEVSQYPPFPVDETKYPIYIFLHKSLNDHFLTVEKSIKGNWNSKGIAFFAFHEQVEGTVPIYRYLHNSNKDHFYTINSNPKGNWKHQGAEFYAYPEESKGTIPIYRYYSKINRDHFYSVNSSAPEGYVEQGIEFHAFPVPSND